MLSKLHWQKRSNRKSQQSFEGHSLSPQASPGTYLASLSCCLLLLKYGEHGGRTRVYEKKRRNRANISPCLQNYSLRDHLWPNLLVDLGFCQEYAVNASLLSTCHLNRHIRVSFHGSWLRKFILTGHQKRQAIQYPSGTHTTSLPSHCTTRPKLKFQYESILQVTR